MDIWDHEGNCRAIYTEAGIDPAAPEGAHRLAWALMGRRCIRYWKPLLGDGAFTPARGGRPSVFARAPERESGLLTPGTIVPTVPLMAKGPELLKAALARRGWSQGDLERALAKHLKRPMSDALVSKWVNGSRMPGLEYALAMEKILDIDPRHWIETASGTGTEG